MEFLRPEFEKYSEKTETGLENSVERLMKMAELKYAENNSMVLVVINGEPNAGKTELKNRFQAYFPKVAGPKPLCTAVTGFQKLETLQEFPEKFLLVEEVIPSALADKLAADSGLTVGLYIYIYNPNLAEHISESSSKRADLIIINPDSVKK
ncbi:MAG: hypothetical protein JNN11_02240 [Candidatus Doudnabacteria bacterium]|nr:hypothetical protein [Candidatus Doudnabacteria bacterium]